MKEATIITHQRSPWREEADSGFSLMEVIIAIAIIGVVAVSSVTLTINGIAAASTQQRSQIAVTIASGAMENVSAQTVAKLYNGRTKSDVLAAFSANSAVPGIAAVGAVLPTYPRWDTTVPLPATAQVPVLSPIVSRSGTDFTLSTLIGSCFQPVTGGNCTTLSNTAATAVIPNYVSLIRIVVIVRWNAGNSCAATGCFYSTTTLINSSEDLRWADHA